MKNFTLTFHELNGFGTVQIVLAEKNLGEAKAHAKPCIGTGYTLVTIVEG